MIAANDPLNDEALPAARCGNCGRWCVNPNGGGVLGLCLVRPGMLRTYSSPSRACDVNGGAAWTPNEIRA